MGPALHGDRAVGNGDGGALAHGVQRQKNVPAVKADAALAAAHRQEIAAAGQPRRALRGGMAHQRLRVRHGRGSAVFHHADLLTVAAAFPQVVADPEDRAVKAREQVGELQLKVPLEVAVERGEGLVEQDRLRLGAEDAGERDALLLPAGELRGILFLQPLQPEHPELFRGQRALFRPAPRADAAENVLLNGHVGKKCILLEEIADPALLRREVDLLFAVEEHAAVQHDPAAVGRHDAGDAFERHALATAGGPEQRQRFVRYLEFRLQTERTEAFFNINIQAHAFALLARLASRKRSRRSSILTASSTTAEITMFTATHR